MNIEYYSNAEELVDKWLAEAEKGNVSYDTSQSSFTSSKAAAAAEEAHRRLLLPSAKEQVSLRTEPMNASCVLENRCISWHRQRKLLHLARLWGSREAQAGHWKRPCYATGAEPSKPQWMLGAATTRRGPAWEKNRAYI